VNVARPLSSNGITMTNLSAQEIATEILTLSESEQQKVLDFIELLKIQSHESSTHPTIGQRILAQLKETGYLGCFSDVPDLSKNYKEYLDWSDQQEATDFIESLKTQLPQQSHLENREVMSRFQASLQKNHRLGELLAR